jgi:hypothetical protein
MKAKKNKRIAALNAAAHRENVLAAAAADRHAKSFSEMFSISAPVESLRPTAEYLADLERNAR